MTRPQYHRGEAHAGNLPDHVIAAFRTRTKRRRGHLLWTGAVDHGTILQLTCALHRYSALQIAWILHYGRDPRGKVIRTCGKPLCVDGRHLSDQAMRQQENLLMAALHGIDMTVTCAAGHARRDHASVAASGKVECRPCHVVRRRTRLCTAPAAVTA
jgi:hypothetical protein